MLEEKTGSVATAFTRLSFQAELARCQRYYEKSYDLGTAVGSAPGAGSCVMFADSGAPNIGYYNPWKVQKRAAPTVTAYDGAGTSGKVSYYVAGWNNGGAVASISSHQAGFYIQTNIASSVALNYEFTADARL